MTSRAARRAEKQRQRRHSLVATVLVGSASAVRAAIAIGVYTRIWARPSSEATEGGSDPLDLVLVGVPADRLAGADRHVGEVRGAGRLVRDGHGGRGRLAG